MNTNINFQISAPASLSIFGEHTKNILRASINLRTTLNFLEVPASHSNIIQINFPQIKLSHKISLQDFSIFHEYIKNTNFSHEAVSQYLFQYESTNQKRFLEIFYYLIVLIMYKEQIEIKPFFIIVYTQLIPNGGIEALTSLKVCLAACLLHWSRLQKGAHSTFDEADLKKICDYAKCCEKIESKDLTDIMVCTYGSVMKEEEQNMHDEWFRLPSMTILLVDSNQKQNVEVQKQQIAKLMNMFPELTNSILNNVDDITNMANNTIRQICDTYKNDELDIETKNFNILLHQQTLEICICKSHRLLQMLGVSYIQLDQICAMAQNLGFYGKYTDLSGGRYALIWRTNVTDFTVLMNNLTTQGFKFWQTNLFCNGVKIE